MNGKCDKCGCLAFPLRDEQLKLCDDCSRADERKALMNQWIDGKLTDQDYFRKTA